MTVKRRDPVGSGVADREAALAGCTERGLPLDGRLPIAGDWAGRVTGGRGQRVERACFAARARASKRRPAPVNAVGALRGMGTVADRDAPLARLRPLGATVVADVVTAEDRARLCDIREPEGRRIGRAQPRGQQTARAKPGAGPR